MDIKIPNLGDGIDSAVVLSILVSLGDTVSDGDTILELETDKAVAPIPCTGSGKVSAILVKEGDTVRTGVAVISLEGASDTTPAPSLPASINTHTSPVAEVIAIPTTQSASYTAQTNIIPITSPSIKRFAARFGLDLGRVQGTGSGGRITDADVASYVSYLQAAAFQASSPVQASAATAIPTLPTLNTDFSKFGPVEIKPASSLRKKIAANLRKTWNEVPHVTQFDEADITNIMALRKKYNPKYIKKDAKLTVTVFTLKAIVEALKEFPHFNASFDEAKGDIIYKNYYHLGVAVDTPAGLIVPVIRDVDKKSILEICLEINSIAEKARQRKVSMDDLQGGTFTLSNLGGLGVGAFTPIVNAPEVAILGIGKGNFVPVFDTSGNMKPRLKMPVCLSYDHRIIDGGDGARFTRKVIDILENFDEKLVKI
jgi:pyruvate dehydrogenase E2 component (dihydrolipoamide acetyltransferase)